MKTKTIPSNLAIDLVGITTIEILSYSLNQWFPWREGRTNSADLKFKLCIWVTRRGGSLASPPFPRPHLMVGSGGRSILSGDLCLLRDCTGLPEISKFFSLFLHLLRPSRPPFILVQDLAALPSCSNCIVVKVLKLLILGIWLNALISALQNSDALKHKIKHFAVPWGISIW